jgi:ferritin-like metal-binding protein YciE
MSDSLDIELVRYLIDVHALEQIGLRLLEEGSQLDAGSAAAEIYRNHAAQTREHLRLINERLAAHRAQAPDLANGHVNVAGLTIEFDAAENRTPAQLAISAYTLENLEIGLYHVLGGLAQALRDEETDRVAARILEEEEEAAELVASTINQASVL